MSIASQCLLERRASGQSQVTDLKEKGCGFSKSGGNYAGESKVG